MKNNKIYQEIEKIYSDKGKAYGEPDVCFGMIASLWSVYLGKEITIKDVGFMMAQLKMAREKCGSGDIDNFVDAANYIALAGDTKEQGRIDKEQNPIENPIEREQARMRW